MSSIIPSHGAEPGAANVTSTQVITGPTTVTTGTFRYATTFDAYSRILVSGANDTATLTNNGTLWSHLTDDNVTNFPSYLVVSLANVVNHGLAVLEINHGLAFGLYFDGTASANSGSIFALSHAGSAWGVITEGAFAPTFTNTGLVAAYAATGSAYGIQFGNGGKLINGAGASILAEGVDARGVVFGNGRSIFNQDGAPDVQNDGLIQAHSLDPQNASIGISVSHLAMLPMQIVNNGTIRADYAVYDNPYVFSPAQTSAETVTNTATGVIEGTISLSLGDDTLVNQGLLTGDVLLGEGSDRFDTRTGTWTGLASLGFGSDVFLGSTGNDAVLGEWGEDLLEGNGGQDLLHGDRGDDTLVGGGGNDGLYGYRGEDLILTQGGDVVLAGTGNDRVELGDYSFALVDGEAGIDTLALPGSGHEVLDLSAVLASGRVERFERIDIAGSQQLIIRSSDATTLSGTGELFVSGSATASARLVGSWSEGAQQTLDGVTYRIFTLNGETLQILNGMEVAVVAAAPAGATGLTAVAAGPAAPLPGSIPGTGLLTGETLSNRFQYKEPLHIEADEVWHSSNGAPLLGTWDPSFPTLTNDGTLLAVSETDPLAQAEGIANFQTLLRVSGLTTAFSTGKGAEVLEVNNSGLITNHGTISATSVSDGAAVGISVGAYGGIVNTGLIAAQAQSHAVAIVTYASAVRDDEATVLNTGDLQVTSTGGLALGIIGHNSSLIDNRGQMTVSGDQGAVGFMGSSALSVDNSGALNVTTTGLGGSESVAFKLYANSYNTLRNSGTVQADVAVDTYGIASYGAFGITNSGTMIGDIRLVDGWDQITNTGSITADVSMRGGNDVYDGHAGTQIGTVHGGNGADTVITGIGNNRLEGDAGNDTLDGGLGADTLVGGAGNDSYTRDNASDVIIEAAKKGVDTVTSSVNYTLAVNVENLVLSGIATHGRGNELANTLTGNGLKNRLFGAAGNDSLVGAAGNDTLDGGLGADTLVGGTGNDSYTRDNASDVVTEAASEGTDTVTSSVNYILAANVENLVLSGASTDGRGNELANVMTGNAMNNRLVGAAGNDTLDGGLGADTLEGGTGDDSYTRDNANDVIIEAAKKGIDTVTSSIDYTLAANVENLVLSGTATHGEGNSLANTIMGNALNNQLTGAAGNDRLYGGAGADTLTGGAGADIFSFDTALDVTANVDVITDMSVGDSIELSSAVFAALGGSGALGVHLFFAGAGITGSASAEQGAGIYYDTTAGNLYYDIDGFSGAAAVQFAHLNGAPTLSYTSFTVVS